MGHGKPFHRNYRGIKQGENSGYSSWAYIVDPEYSIKSEHYVRAYLLIQNDLESIFEYVEPSDEGRKAYSYRIHALLMRTCIEIEANFRAILAENICTRETHNINISDFRKVDVTHHLSSYEVMLPIWNGQQHTRTPFEEWKSIRGLPNPDKIVPPWYQAYNQSKHDRFEKFKMANLENLVTAVTALLVLISSQFRDEDFSAGSISLGVSGLDVHPMEAATGSLFRIKYPDDWTDDELYDFDWTKLKTQPNRFKKIDFDAIQR